MMLKYLEKDYAAFPESERDKPAYTAGKEGTLPRIRGEVSTDATGSPLMRANPKYWNTGLPRSAVQFMYCTIINNKAYTKKEKEYLLKNNSISYKSLPLFGDAR